MKLRLVLLLVVLLLPASAELLWWNSSWEYRVCFEINSTSYSRQDWPMEIPLNLTKELNSSDFPLINESSLRVIEYNVSSGEALDEEVENQFDKNSNFNDSTNFDGTLIFLMNGTLAANNIRQYCLYYDTDVKQSPNFTLMSYYWDGEELQVNVSIKEGSSTKGLQYYIDTSRGENTSGLYRVRDYGDNEFWSIPSSTNKTIEYIQYTNSTYNYSYDFHDNMTLVHEGPVRLVFEQNGEEVIWNSTNLTNEGYMTKKYVFYKQNQWFKVEQHFNNTASYNISRASTKAGALSLPITDIGYDYVILGNNTEPYSWNWFASDSANFHYGVINTENSGNYSEVDRTSVNGRGGIELTSSIIEPNHEMYDIAVFHFNGPQNIKGSPAHTQVEGIRNALLFKENTSKIISERWIAITYPFTNFSTYNRGENITLEVNLTHNTGIVSTVNATLFFTNGNKSFDLYDDGSHGDNLANNSVYSNYFVVNETDVAEIWNFTSYTWDKENILLNTSVNQINITKDYSATLVIKEKFGFVNRLVESVFTLKNFRQDTYIPGANVSCEYDAIDANINYTDQGNGTYLINFTAPGTYTSTDLICYGTKLNNTGSARDNFTAIEGSTQLNTTLNFSQPNLILKDINSTHGENFTLLANVTNLGNGTTNNINISLFLLPGWTANTTFVQLTNLNISEYIVVPFEIHAPKNTSYGNYTVNTSVMWENTDATSNTNKVSIDVQVGKNPILGVFETSFYAATSPGFWNTIGNITVQDLGNYDVHNITFNVTGIPTMTFRYTPQNISSLFQNENESVLFEVWLPQSHPRGTFNGFVYINSSNGGNISRPLQIEILETYFSVNATPNKTTANHMRWTEFQNFSIKVNATNMGGSTGVNANITLVLPDSDWQTNYSNDVYICGDIDADSFCAPIFNLGVMKSVPGNYSVFANVTWYNPGIGVSYNTTEIIVEVLNHTEFIIHENNISGTIIHGTNGILGNFTLENSGNIQINSVAMQTIGLSDFTVEVNPVYTSFSVGFSDVFDVNVTVPLGYSPGNYSGILNISTANAGDILLDLNVTVPTSRTWTISPTNCTTPVALDLGKMCDVRVNNTGNVQMEFYISPLSVNYTYPDTNYFLIENQSFHDFDFMWNITGVPRDFYNATYNISANFSTPDYVMFDLHMIPSELAEINVSLSSNISEELQNVTVYVNVSDKSLQGLQYTQIKVYKPDNSTESFNLTATFIFNHTYYYETNYPGTWGINNIYGNYTLMIISKDNLNLVSTKNISLFVYPLVNISLNTGFQTYFAGETASLFINLTDASGMLLETNGTLQIYDVLENLRYTQTFSTTGPIYPVPQFTIPSDSDIGNYTIKVNANHFDSISNKTSYDNITQNIKIRERYNVEFETSISWYPDSVMQFYVLAYTDKDFEDVDSIKLTVFDPAQNIYFETSTFTEVNTTNTSKLYMYSHAMGANSPVGYYLAQLTLEEGGRQIQKLKSFRVSYGGPYDVVITDYDAEVEKGKAQDFDILLENMGDFSQDVFVSYWVEGLDGTKYASSYGEAIYIEGGGNRSLTRQLPISSNLATGDYQLHVKLNYSTIKPPIEVYKTFKVIESTQTPPEEPVSPLPLTPVEAVVIEVSVTNVFPEEMIINRGSIGYLTIEIKNTGNVPLNDITVFFEDIERDWFEVVRDVNLLGTGSSGYIVVKFSIPSDADARTYVSKMRIIAKEVEVSEYYKILVFKTQTAAMFAKVNSLRNTLGGLEDQAGALAARGKDVTKILSLLRKAREFLDISETYLEEDNTVDAIKTISDVESVLEEIKYRIENSSPSILPIPKMPHVPSNWYVWGVSLLTLAILLVFIVKKFKRYKNEDRQKSLIKLKDAMEISRKEGEGSGVYQTLKSQYADGMISRETFEDLKRLLK